MSLTKKIIILIFISLLLNTIFILLLSLYQQKVLQNKAETAFIQTLVISLRDAIVSDVIDNNELRVTDLLKEIKNNSNSIVFLYLTKNGNSVFAHSFEKGFPRYLFNNINHAYKSSEVILNHRYQTETKLINEYSTVLIQGIDTSIHIGIDQSESESILRENVIQIIIGSIGITFLLLIAVFWNTIKIIYPLNHLSSLITGYKEGEIIQLDKVETKIPEIRQLVFALKSAFKERDNSFKILKEHEQDLLITLNSIGDGVISTDEKGRVVRMNPVAEDLTGWSFDEAHGMLIKTIFPVINTTTRKVMQNPVEKVISNGKTMHLSNHTTLVTKDAIEYQIANSAAPIINSDGRTSGVVVIFHDVTKEYKIQKELNLYRDNLEELVSSRTKKLNDSIVQLTNAQNKLIESEKMASLGSLVAGIAHEINTPVGSSITGITHIQDLSKNINQQLQNKTLKKSLLENYVKDINIMSESVRVSLVNAANIVKSFKQIAVDQHAEEIRDFNLYKYIQSVLLNLKSAIKNERIHIDNHIDKELNIYSYPGVFSQIITNLVMNSKIHAFDSDIDGVIEINIKQDNNNLIFTYKDNGKGMSENTIKHIFDPFFTTKLGQGGSGLGMHIIYNLITQKMKGTIECDSELNVGTEFIINIPIKK